MKTYNRALDLIALAMQQVQKGNPTTAAKLLVKAATAPDADRAIGILEASNAQAFAATAAAKKEKVAAAAKPAPAKAAVKPTPTKAASRVKADEEVEDDLADLVEDEEAEGEEGEAEEFEEAEEDEEELDEDEAMGDTIAAVLASMIKTKASAAPAPKAKAKK